MKWKGYSILWTVIFVATLAIILFIAWFVPWLQKNPLILVLAALLATAALLVEIATEER